MEEWNSGGRGVWERFPIADESIGMDTLPFVKV